MEEDLRELTEAELDEVSGGDSIPFFGSAVNISQIFENFPGGVVNVHIP